MSVETGSAKLSSRNSNQLSQTVNIKSETPNSIYRDLRIFELIDKKHVSATLELSNSIREPGEALKNRSESHKISKNYSFKLNSSENITYLAPAQSQIQMPNLLKP